MQFIVLIEFLVPGLVTTLLAIALLPPGAVPLTFQGLPSGDTTSALLLLAISYPVGILTNFLTFLLQRLIIVPRLHRKLIERYSVLGIDLVELAGQQLGLKGNVKLSSRSRSELRELFNLLRTVAVSGNIERLNKMIAFQEGLQRFARGMLLPLILAFCLVSTRQSPSFPLQIISVVFFLLSLLLLGYSLSNEEKFIARFFVTQVTRQANPESAKTGPSTSGVPMSLVEATPANPTLNRTPGGAA